MYARELDCGEPQRRLPDTGLAFEDERLRPVLLVTIDERAKGRELGVPANDFCHHRHATIVTDVTTNPNLAGRRLFDQLPQRTELERTGLSETDGVTHLEYRVVR